MKTLEVLEKYLKSHDLTWHTVASYRNIMNKLSEYSPDFPENAGIMNEWLVWLKDNKHLNTTTRINFRRGIISVIKYMNAIYDFPDYTKKIQKIKSESYDYQYHDPQEIARFLSVCDSDHDRALAMVLIDSDCRIGDIGYDPKDPVRHPGLKGKDVQYDGIKTWGKTGFHEYRCKPSLAQGLKNLAGNDDNYVFCRYSRDKKPLKDQPATVMGLQARVRLLFKKAGVTGHTGPHSLRHFSAALIAEETESLLAVKAVIGDKSDTIAQRYIHGVQDKLKKKHSPLDILAKKVFSSTDTPFVQAQLLKEPGNGDSTALIPAENPKDLIGDSLIEDSFSLIHDDFKSIRPLLKAEDLQLIRRAFITLSKYGQAIGDPAQARALFRRMTRKSDV